MSDKFKTAESAPCGLSVPDIIFVKAVMQFFGGDFLCNNMAVMVEFTGSKSMDFSQSGMNSFSFGFEFCFIICSDPDFKLARFKCNLCDAVVIYRIVFA